MPLKFFLACLLLPFVCHAQENLPSKALEILHIQTSEGKQAFTDILSELTYEILAPYSAQKFLKPLAPLNGDYKRYWEGDHLKFKADFKNSLPDGHFHGYYPNGSDAFKGHIENGKKLGVHIAFYPPKKGSEVSSNGRILTYNDEGKLSGEQIVFHPNGSLWALVTYKDGVIDGQVIMSDDEGRRIETLLYKEGQPVK